MTNEIPINTKCKLNDFWNLSLISFTKLFMIKPTLSLCCMGQYSKQILYFWGNWEKVLKYIDKSESQ